MAYKVLVVFGATGNQGRAVLQSFARRTREDQWILKGITRNIDSEAALSLGRSRIQMVAADLDDVGSLISALQGATHVFANTDSNRIIAYASQHPEILPPGQIPTTFARDVEMRHGRNLRDALSACQTLERVVWSSLPSPKKWSGGRYTKVTMFDGKEEIIDMVREDSFLSSKVSVLLVGFYAENAFNVPELYAPEKQHESTYQLSFPMPGDVAIPFADVGADAGTWVDALFQAPAGLTLVGASDWHTWDQWTRCWAEVNNVNATYRQISVDEYASRKKDIGEAVAQEFEFVWKYGFAGGNREAMTPKDLERFRITVIGTNFQDYIKSVDWSRLL